MTWGHEVNNIHLNSNPEIHGQIIFQVGFDKTQTYGINKLLKESERYGDLLIQDFIEHYNNLTIKTVLLLKFVNQLAAIPSFIFKVT